MVFYWLIKVLFLEATIQLKLLVHAIFEGEVTVFNLEYIRPVTSKRIQQFLWCQFLVELQMTCSILFKGHENCWLQLLLPRCLLWVLHFLSGIFVSRDNLFRYTISAILYLLPLLYQLFLLNKSLRALRSTLKSVLLHHLIFIWTTLGREA